MGRLTRHRHLAGAPAAIDLDAALASIEAMTMDDLRDLWRERRGGEPPAALSKDLIARVLTYRLQEEHLGGLDSWTRKRLDSSSPKKAVGPYRQVKVGSVIVREYQGTLHEVLVVPEGFCWQKQVYSSLSTIAGKITGTSWNGPRFFGLRGKGEPTASEVAGPARVPSGPKAPSRSGSIKVRSPINGHGAGA